jgi:hypothetical protein
MTTNTGLVTIYDNTVPDKRMVTDRILNMNPLEVVAYSYLGTDMGKFAFTNIDETLYEWLNDTNIPRTDILTDVLSDTTGTTVTVTTAALFQPGDVWKVDSELIWVSSMSGSVITMTRGFAGSTAATHADNVVATRVSRARIDGDDADDSPSTEVTSSYNYTQIFQRTVNLSRSSLKKNRYGIANLEDYMINKHMDEMMMDLSLLPYHGGRGAGTENTVARSAGGLNTFITGNVTYATSTALTGGTALALTRRHIDDTFALIHADGGDPNLIMTTSWAQRKVNDFYEGFVSTERSEQLGGILIKKLQNPISGKIVDIAVDRKCPSGQLWMLDTGYISYYPYDPFFYERLAKTGDAVKGEVVGEYGFVVANADWHGVVKEFSESL